MVFFNFRGSDRGSNFYFDNFNGLIIPISKVKRGDQKIYIDDIYMSSRAKFNGLKSRVEKDIGRGCDLIEMKKSEVLKIAKMPIEIRTSEDNSHLIKNLNRKGTKKRILLYLPTGGIGDGLLFMWALRSFKSYIENYTGESCEFTLVTVSDNIVKLAKGEFSVDEIIHSYTISIKEMIKFDCFYDFSSMADSKEFNDRNMMEYYLYRLLGKNWKNCISIEDVDRRLFVNPQVKERIDRVIGEEEFILFHGDSTAWIRSIPEKFREDIIRNLYEKYRCKIFSVDSTKLNLPYFNNISHLSSGIWEYVEITSRAKRIFSIDTSVYHIASSFNIPGEVVFTSIDPEIRCSYYKEIRGIIPKGFKESKFWGLHSGKKGELSEEEYTHLWSNFIDNLRGER